MIEKKLIIANWKMYKTFSEAKTYVDDLIKQCKQKDFSKNTDVVFAPPFHLLEFFKKLVITLPIKISAQDCSALSSVEGAFTGDISASMLKDAGCDYVILGHSERRKYHHESNNEIKQKIINAHKEGLKVILCIGETLQERESGDYKHVLWQMLLESLPDVLEQDIIIAYEPVWAIGTGKTATLGQIEELHKFLYEISLARFAKEMKIIYGGSVNLDNAKQILQIDKVSGLLVGGASLDPEKFYNLVKKVEG